MKLITLNSLKYFKSKLLESSKNHSMRIYSPSNMAMTASTNYACYTIPYTDVVSTSNNTKLTFDPENHTIKIGKGVSKVLVSVWTLLSIEASFYYGLYIRHNDIQVVGRWESSYIGYSCRCIPQYLLDVQEGDRIAGGIYFGTKGNSLDILQSSYLTVEVIE